MKRVGITGGIGSGKSLVCKILGILGIPVFSADEEARKLLDEKPVMQAIRKHFGERVFTGERVDRKKLAGIVFSDKQALLQLNRLVHPLLSRRFDQWVAGWSHEIPYVVIDAALLIESRQYFPLDHLVLVYSPVEERIARVMKRDGISREEILLRMSNQMPEEEKMQYVHTILYNDSEHFLLPQILAMDGKLRS